MPKRITGGAVPPSLKVAESAGPPPPPVTTPAKSSTGWTPKAKQATPVGQATALRWGMAKKTDRTHDGQLLGADGKFYAADTPLDQIPPVMPDNGKPAKDLIIEINGIMTPGALHQKTLQALANSGARVVGIHNATEGMLSDLTETVKDKLDLGKNPAVDTTRRL